METIRNCDKCDKEDSINCISGLCPSCNNENDDCKFCELERQKDFSEVLYEERLQELKEENNNKDLK